MKLKVSWTKARKEWDQVVVGERECPQCNIIFPVRQGYRRQKHCSPHCARQANRIKKTKKPCPVCGTAFYSPAKIQQTCSVSCGAIHMGMKQKKSAPIEKVPVNIREEICHQDGECRKYSECGGRKYKKKVPCFIKERMTSGVQGISSVCSVNL